VGACTVPTAARLVAALPPLFGAAPVSCANFCHGAVQADPGRHAAPSMVKCRPPIRCKNRAM